MAKHYSDGKYIQKSEEKVFYWSRKAAINGIRDAQCKLAEYYHSNSNIKVKIKSIKWRLKCVYPRKYDTEDGVCGVIGKIKHHDDVLNGSNKNENLE